MTKALALLSGGLDSTLAIEVIKRQGIEVEALNIVTSFCRCTAAGSCKLEAIKVSEKLNVPIKVINSTKDMLEIIKKPKFGFGKNINPCIDCRINLFRAAGKYMREIDASFIFTGEVLGQRPMSQRKEAMRKIDSEADLTGYVLRPLCAKHMEPTIPEKEGLVDREKLLSIKGRSRKEQFQLADIFEIKDYRCPAGGCALTDPEYAHRMRDLMKYSDPSVNDVNLLNVGRHFRVDPKTKIIMGRRDEDNTRLESLAKESDLVFFMEKIQGPLAILRGELTDANIQLAASMIASYSKEQDQSVASVKVMTKGDEEGGRVLSVAPKNMDEIRAMMIKKPLKKSVSKSIDKRQDSSNTKCDQPVSV